MSLANSLKTNKIPQTLAETRVEQLSRLVANQCPSHHVDFYVFTIAVLCVICSAIFTFVARSLHISMWCPLLLLLIPTALSFWTSKRRSTLIIKIKEFESALKKTLYEYTATDQTIKWSLQRVPIDEAPCTSVRFCLVIHVTELDPEMVYVGEELPSYQTALLNTTNTFHPPSYHELTAPPQAVVVS
ncbi:hypothetical protein HMPREF1544_05484 [Mucor circinelloides 1006PhL]|uniref:Uncharacterized protein n=1 Tax=Mucor circinelloides f. circinelloides (strain 1006PhL) TaxID=1220926 RepID=S2JY31_MUCC1|nr:hypothetical protein HMPREF1544_05484 [Mucor circinelloides 1006PhL]